MKEVRVRKELQEIRDKGIRDKGQGIGRCRERIPKKKREAGD